MYPRIIELLCADHERAASRWTAHAQARAHAAARVTPLQLDCAGLESAAHAADHGIATRCSSGCLVTNGEHSASGMHSREPSVASTPAAAPSSPRAARHSHTPSLASLSSRCSYASLPASAAAPSDMSVVFSRAVLQRDRYRCVVCRESSRHLLSATHLLPPPPQSLSTDSSQSADACDQHDSQWEEEAESIDDSPSPSSSLLLSAGLLHAYETSNGLTLCVECRHAFESCEWTLDSVTARTLVALSGAGDRWLQRAGFSVAAPPPHSQLARHWPTPAIMHAQQRYARNKRDAIAMQHQ